jgi:hypothetical protein
MAFHVFRDEPVEPLLLDRVDPLQSHRDLEQVGW